MSAISQERLKDLLVLPGHISQEDFELATSQAREQKKEIEDILIEKGLIQDEQLGKLLADQFNTPFIDLRKETIDEEVLYLIPEQVARSKGVVAFAKGNEGIKVGMRDPKDLETVHMIEKRTSQKVIPYFITRLDLQEALSRYKSGIGEEFDRLVNEFHAPSSTGEEQDQTIVKMVDTLLQYGYYNRASDIHIEPYHERVAVRFRVDGVLHDMVQIPKELLDPILTRIKILARMRTDEHRAIQEGRLRFDAKEELIDVRVSVVPVPEGENTVMRLLSSKGRELVLGGLGLSDRDLTNVRRALKKPHGMILATGPTGCGKTTTIYAMVRIIHSREIHIATIEDPIEYGVEGITQIQVNPKVNLIFAQGLRAIVRQDPDVILVGEIRDQETAGIGVNAAMIGHLVLSTLHANNAATTLTRLLDMGIEPFLLASTVNLVIAQRLVRRICEKCRASYSLTAQEREAIKAQPSLSQIAVKRQGGLGMVRLYKGMGCKTCSYKGLSGRIGIFEVLEVTDEIKSLITKQATSEEITKVAIDQGMITMPQDGFQKALNGITTFEEVLRVTQEE